MADNNELERTLWATADKLRNNMDAAQYKHVVCKSATIDEVRKNSHVLMPGRYVGTESNRRQHSF
jgi:type I restriction-modification system DNA methylase subunit